MNGSLHYLEDTRRIFEHYKALAERAVAQVPEASLNWQYNSESNSIAIIVKHLSGNMCSRWTDFLSSDGEKPWRDRDGEFDPAALSRDGVLKIWEDGWACLQASFRSLTPADLERTIYIRGEAHSVMEAINRQLAHLIYHVGQIVLLAKMCAGKDWTALTIPRGASKAFNAAMFSKAPAGDAEAPGKDS